MPLRASLRNLLYCLALFFFCFITQTPAFASDAKGTIKFEDTFHDFGNVTEGDLIKAAFKFKNAGKGPFKLVKIETSCGCTTTDGVLKEYKPGEASTLEVTIDTRGKHGITVKTIKLTLENATEPVVELNLSATLVPPPHPVAEHGMLPTKEGKCKSCHLDAGVGEKGVFLYHRICVQCHGPKGAGASAKALNDPAWLGAASDDYIREVTAKGSPESGMPPYVEGVSPPLTTEQMDSLIAYIRSLAKK
jgi:cytochrome c553